MDLQTFLYALTSFMVIVDPIGGSLLFNSLTTGKNQSRIRILAFKSVGVSVVVVTLFAFFGESLLNQLGIKIESLRIAGGIMLFYTAFNLITAAPKYEILDNTSDDIYVYPMAIPLLAGPGALTMTVLLFSSATSMTETVSTILALGATYGIALMSLLLASRVSAFFGKTGNDVIRRLMGILLAALAVQFVTDGVKQLFFISG